MSELQPGAFLGHYELLVRVGRGGMASVWVARERSAVSGKQRFVAVKAMLPELASHSEFRSMFLSEVQIIQSIEHDNVVRVFEVSEDRNVLYMAMEWVEGDSLRNIIRASHSRGALPPEIAVCIAADAASGLHAAHELRDWDGQLRGVVHCDVSPHNILVGLEGKAKLVDFGIASALEQLGSGQDQETIQGKVSYMSPEQALGEKVDRRTDVFALGIVLYEMTMGAQLFRGRDAAHTLELVKRGKIPRPTLLNPNYPKKLEPIVLKSLERDPEQRFQSAEEFEYELSTYLTEEHAVVSHPVVAKLLWQLHGSRIEKRREVISSIVSSIDSHRPVDKLAGRASLVADISLPGDPLNFTATGLSESRLGIAARLETENTRSIALSIRRVSRNIEAMPWRTIVTLIALSFLIAGSGLYYFVARPRLAESATLARPNDGGLIDSTAKPAPSAKPSADATIRSDGVLSVDSLPVDSRQEVVSPGDKTRSVVVGRRGGKSFDQQVAEAAAAAARKGGVAQSERNPAGSDNNPAAAPAAGIDRSAANASLASAASAARACRSQGPPPTPGGRAAVTFAPTGSVSAVSISQNYLGTAIGNCIMANFRNARVPPFSGDPVTINASFQMPE
jgi:eukaryotic-like serine/threonine-protein kinase